MIVLDTNILIYMLNGNPDILDYLERLETEFYITSISLLELSVGRKKQKLSQEELDDFLENFIILSFDKSAAKILSNHLQEKNKKLRKGHLPDLFIAAICVAKGYKLLTNNEKDFQSFDRLDILSV